MNVFKTSGKRDTFCYLDKAEVSLPESGRLWINPIMWASMSARSLKGRWDHIAAEMMGHFSTTLPNRFTNSSYVRAFTTLMSMAPARVLYKLFWKWQKPTLDEVNVHWGKYSSHLNISNCLNVAHWGGFVAYSLHVAYIPSLHTTGMIIGVYRPITNLKYFSLESSTVMRRLSL